jgi:hypothetical protein
VFRLEWITRSLKRALALDERISEGKIAVLDRMGGPERAV